MAEKQPHVKGDGKLPLSSGHFNSLHSVNVFMIGYDICIEMHELKNNNAKTINDTLKSN